MLFPIIKTEDVEYKGKKVRIYKVSKIRKSLIKRLKKDNINKVAVEKCLDFNGEFKRIEEKEILLENLPLIVKKGAGVLGIKKGKLKLGIIANGDMNIFRNIHKLKDILKTVYIYSKEKDSFLKWGDDFFRSTGIPVVIRKGIEKNQADILIISETDVCFKESDIKLTLDFSGERRGDEIKLKIPEIIDKYDVSNWVIASIFETGYHLDGFAKKSLTQSHKNNIII